MMGDHGMMGWMIMDLMISGELDLNLKLADEI